MAIEILMPALSPTMEEGTLAKWLVAEGAEVRSGDVIAEIETDKATMDVEALDDGTIGKILIAAGTEGVKVNSPIAVLLEEGESADAVASAAPAAAPDTPSPPLQDAPRARGRAVVGARVDVGPFGPPRDSRDVAEHGAAGVDGRFSPNAAATVRLRSFAAAAGPRGCHRSGLR